MGQKSVRTTADGEQRRGFMRHLLRDLQVLGMMIEEGWIERGVRRIGAEQEMFLVDRNWRPAPVAIELLDNLADSDFTTELGQFNLELNLEPCEFGQSCLEKMERRLSDKLVKARAAAEKIGVQIVLTGILPTIRNSDLGLDNMTPIPRYHALNQAMSEMRGGAYEFHIKGLDELLIRHDSVMLEACNASFQVHFQASAEEFPNLYNIAQVAAAPVLAAAVNSPLLFGRQLWRETRIALFQQAVDTRSSIDHLRDRSPRVNFGRRWVRGSVLELFQEDIARFRALIAGDIEVDSMAQFRRGEVPELAALKLHNGTVYRWNRACYGISPGGKPHLRIENRVLPSGPSIGDEVANATFWLGLISALSDKYDDITRVIEFEDASMNFTSAARLGLGSQLTWINGETISTTGLICDRLIPMAADALRARGLESGHVDRYLGIVDRRVSTHRTGAQWQIQSLAMMRGQGTSSERLSALCAATVKRQRDNQPVHEWQPAHLKEAGGWKHTFLRVEQYMTTDLFTVQEDEPLDLVASLMEWERIRHVPVEDLQHRLVGLVSYRALLRMLARGKLLDGGRSVAVSEVMRPDPVTIAPEASTLEAIKLMRQHQVGCLPVVKNERLVGIVTERDFMEVSAQLLEKKLKE